MSKTKFSTIISFNNKVNRGMYLQNTSGLMVRTQYEIQDYIKPGFYVPDPFRGAPNLLVLCETFQNDKTPPSRYNFRWIAKYIMHPSGNSKWALWKVSSVEIICGWMTRQILERVGEEFGIEVTNEPKPISEDWTGEGGYDFIVPTLMPLHDQSRWKVMKVYGAEKDKRLTGAHETSLFNKFTWGVDLEEDSFECLLQLSKKTKVIWKTEDQLEILTPAQLGLLQSIQLYQEENTWIKCNNSQKRPSKAELLIIKCV